MIQLKGIVGPLHNYIDGSFRISVVVSREMIEKVFELQKNQDGEMIVQFFTIDEARELAKAEIEFQKLNLNKGFVEVDDQKIAEITKLPDEAYCRCSPHESEQTKTLRSRIFLHLKNAGMENKRAMLCQNTFGVDGLSKLNHRQLESLFSLIMKDYIDTDSHAYLINPYDPYDVQIMDYTSLTARIITMTEEGWEPE